MQIHHNLPHWNYYRLLEQDLEGCFRYVQPCEAHFGVYSDEFARVILIASSEIENALRTFSSYTQYTPEPSSIHKFHSCLTSFYPKFCEMKLILPRYSLQIKPWDGWSNTSAPDWWSLGYNKIKHDRLNHPTAPTMIRAITSLGALQVVLLHFYKKRFPGCFMPFEISPQLLLPWDEDDRNYGAGILWDWRLPDDSIQIS